MRLQFVEFVSMQQDNLHLVAVMGIRTNSKLEVQVFCSILGTASEVGSGNRVIERKPLAESLP